MITVPELIKVHENPLWLGSLLGVLFVYLFLDQNLNGSEKKNGPLIQNT